MLFAALLHLAGKTADFAAFRDDEEGFRHLRKLDVEQFVGFVVRASIRRQRCQEADPEHGAGDQPDQPPAQ